jgi:hypothetical protein
MLRRFHSWEGLPNEGTSSTSMRSVAYAGIAQTRRFRKTTMLLRGLLARLTSTPAILQHPLPLPQLRKNLQLPEAPVVSIGQASTTDRDSDEKDDVRHGTPHTLFLISHSERAGYHSVCSVDSTLDWVSMLPRHGSNNH